MPYNSLLLQCFSCATSTTTTSTSFPDEKMQKFSLKRIKLIGAMVLKPKQILNKKYVPF